MAHHIQDKKSSRSLFIVFPSPSIRKMIIKKSINQLKVFVFVDIYKMNNLTITVVSSACELWNYIIVDIL